MNAHARLTGTPVKPLLTETGKAMLSLAKTLKRIAHEYKREALEWEAKGNLKFYRECRAASTEAWRKAWFYLDHADMNRITL